MLFEYGARALITLISAEVIQAFMLFPLFGI